jgi:hypothetical protein
LAPWGREVVWEPEPAALVPGAGAPDLELAVARGAAPESAREPGRDSEEPARAPVPAGYSAPG